jgi:hypothetical protein
MDKAIWGTDVDPSRPDVPPQPVLIDLGGSGFAFTTGGIAHNVTQLDIEDYTTPTFAPTTPLRGSQ